MTDLGALLAELRQKQAVLAKSMPADAADPAADAADPAAAAAADAPEGDAADAAATAADAAEPAAAAADAPEGDEAEGDDAEGEDFGKSQTLFDADGNPVPAFDGWELIKSMQDSLDSLTARLDAAEAKAAEDVSKSFTDQMAGFGESSVALAKSLGDALDALTVTRAENAEMAKSLGDMAAEMIAQKKVIKSLSETVAQVGVTGRGRQSVVNVQERPSPLPITKSQSVGEIFAKAQALNAEGKLSSVDVARVVARANSGTALPDEFAHLFAA